MSRADLLAISTAFYGAPDRVRRDVAAWIRTQGEDGYADGIADGLLRAAPNRCERAVREVA